MNRRSVLLYRLYFAPKQLLQKIMQRAPATVRPIRRCQQWVKHLLLSEGNSWVQVQSGLSSQLSMRLQFPQEAAVWRGEHEPEVQAAIASVVRRGWVVFDIGSHVGSLALGAARLVGPGGQVIGFDGDPVNVQRLREHALVNGLHEVLQVIHAAVWSSGAGETIPFRRGREMLTQGGVEIGDNHPLLGDGELIRVPAISLDAFLASGARTPDLIKIDVEGGEVEVLRGGERLFATKRPLMIVEIHTRDAHRQIQAWLRQNAYSATEIVLFDPVPVRLFAWPKELDPGPGPTPWTQAGEAK